jgi:hypothetical protein
LTTSKTAKKGAKIMTVYDKIAQQQGQDDTTKVFNVGEHLKDIIRGNPALEDIVDKDLDVAEMSLAKAEQQIHQWADKNRKGKNSVCVPPRVAEDILRKFYGLPERETIAGQTPPKAIAAKIIDLDDFFR